jgi:hypothetical protein
MTAHVAIPIHKVMRSNLLLGNFFSGPSWDTWEAVLKAAHGIKLNETEVTAFTAVAGRSPPTKPVRELIITAGRGAGKDAVASLDVSHAAISFDPRGKVRPGENVYVMAIACDRDQAGILFNFIRGYFDEVPALKKLVRDVNADSITLSNRVVIQVTTNSYRSVRGRSILRAVLDEVAHFRSDNSANPDFELHGALTPGLARVPGSAMVLISSAHKRSGLLYERYKTFYGKDDDDVLVVKGTTRQFNPTFDQREIDRALASDPQLYGAEYLSEWRDDLSAFIDRALVEAATDIGIVVRAPQSGVRYVSFVDASGGRGDSSTCGIAHAEGQTAVLDCLIEIRSPHDPAIASRDISIVLKSYGITKTVADHYSANWAVGTFARNGIKLENSDRDRSKIYLDALPLFTSGRVKLIDNQRLAAQFYNLERRTFPSGQDKVNHPPGGHDDCCNAAAGALVLAAAGSKSLIIPKELLRAVHERAPRGIPRQRLTDLAPRFRKKVFS